MFSSNINNSANHITNLKNKLDWKCIGSVFLAFMVTRAMVVLVTYLSMAEIPVRIGEGLVRYNPRNIIPDGLIRWDSFWYIGIASNGYDAKSAAFFPLYPTLIKIFSLVTGNIMTSGLFVSNFAFLIALFYVYKIAQQEFDNQTASRAVFYISAAPSAFFFSTVYSESVFLLFLVASIYYAINKKWFLAAIAGAFASATRLTGVLPAVFIFFESLWRQEIRFFPKPWGLKEQFVLIKNNLKKFPGAWKGFFASLFSVSGLITYMFYLNHKFGDPLAFLHAENNWDKSVGWDWIQRLFLNIYNMHKSTGSVFSGGIGSISYLMDTLAIIVFIPLVILVFVRFRPSYGWYSILAFLLPLLSGSPISMRRYVLAIIPCYLLLAFWGKRQWLDRVILGISLPLQVYSLILFSHWYTAG